MQLRRFCEDMKKNKPLWAKQEFMIKAKITIKRKKQLEVVKKNIGKHLYTKLTPKQKEFMNKTAGVIEFEKEISIEYEKK